ncbi:M15 family metallopeptidase [Alpinimonas psychrophila]|uniref:M15 family metallopeptidase n=1 Tax=Alpinimonas psychrophila TaxID=748908 RepID=UPI001FEB0D8C|nr:M15 family metallopeptidase [Alpinimonas psychrophila]
MAIVGTILFSLAGCATPTTPASTSSVAESASPSATAPVSAPVTPTTPTFDRTLLSLDDPNSLWVISNKRRPLNPVDFAPSDLSIPVGVPNEFTQPLREAAARAVEAMYTDAVAQGVNFGIISAYRDYGTQVSLYNRYVARDGQEAADTYSARPGHSEHQTGLAVDFDDGGACYLNACFESTVAGQWLAANAANYGFVLRYPNGQDTITGFTYEPWHFRYVGVGAAQAMRDAGTLTLEQFFGLHPAPGYL